MYVRALSSLSFSIDAKLGCYLNKIYADFNTLVHFRYLSLNVLFVLVHVLDGGDAAAAAAVVCLLPFILFD